MHATAIVKVLACLLAGLCGGCATQSIEWSARIGSVVTLVDRRLGDVAGKQVQQFAGGRYATVNIVTPTRRLPAHYHVEHDETVYLVRGHGTLRLGDEIQLIEAGVLVFIPAGTIHAFTPGGDDCIAVSVVSPADDGADHVAVVE